MFGRSSNRWVIESHSWGPGMPQAALIAFMSKVSPDCARGPEDEATESTEERGDEEGMVTLEGQSVSDVADKPCACTDANVFGVRETETVIEDKW